MRCLAYIFAVLLAAAGLPLLTAPVQAQQMAQANSRAAIIEACMKDVRSGLKAGQKLTEQQRMVAEEQCRARAEAAQANK